MEPANPAPDAKSPEARLASSWGKSAPPTAAAAAPPPAPPAAGDKPPAAPAAPPPAEVPPVTTAPAGVGADDVQKMIDKAVGSQQQQFQATTARDTYIRDKMKDLPPGLAQQLMPNTGDPAQLAAAEKVMRTELQAWFKAELNRAGVKWPNIGGPSASGGGIPASPIIAGKPSDNSPTAKLGRAMEAGKAKS